MEPAKNTITIHPLVIFGALTGVACIATSLLFLLFGRPVALNPQISNITLALMILGIYFGVRTYRNDHLGGTIPYSKAFTSSLTVTLVAAGIYVVYTIALYSLRPELVAAFQQTLADTYQQILGPSFYNAAMDETLKQAITPWTIGLTEALQKALYGTIFALLLALLVKKNPAPPVNNY